MKKYYLQLLSACCIILGCFLLLEHLYMWGGFDFLDFLGHETYGIIILVIGIVLGYITKKVKEK